MHNPMTYDFVRVASQKYPEPLSNLISAVDRFAYDATWPIESILGEYSGNMFNSTVLRLAVQKSIWDDSDFYSRGAHGLLVPVFNSSGLGGEYRNRILQIVEDEAFRRISQAIIKDVDGSERFREHGHHGRQYIARNSTERLVREVLPPWSKALVRSYEKRA
jgi:hypothetical protein